jgi:hypothetical protein
MKTIKAFGPFNVRFIPLLCFSIASILFAYCYKGELKQTYDSADYLNSSSSLHAYLTGKNQDGFAFLYRPPLLPAFLYFFENKAEAAKWLNALCFISSLWIGYFLAGSLQVQGLLLYAYPCMLAMSFPWLQNHFFLWSEPLFSTLILLLTFLLVNKRPVFLILIVCLAAYFLRKAGLLLAIGVLINYMFERSYKKVIWVCLVMTIAFFIWEGIIIYFSNESTSKSVFLMLNEMSRSYYVDVLTAWILPRNISLVIRVCLSISMAILLGRLFYGAISNVASSHGSRVVLRIFLVYTSMLVLFIGTADYHDAERFLSPVLPLFLLLIVLMVQKAYATPGVQGKFMFVFFLIWWVYPISRTVFHLLANG